MSSSFNKIILIGYVGQDPMMFNSDSGIKKASFSLATDESYKDKQTGEKINRSEWHNIVCWSNLADVTETHIHKGDFLLVEGKKLTRQYESKEGVKMHIVDIHANKIEFLKSCSKCGNPEKYVNNDRNAVSDVFVQDDPIKDDLPF